MFNELEIKKEEIVSPSTRSESVFGKINQPSGKKVSGFRKISDNLNKPEISNKEDVTNGHSDDFSEMAVKLDKNSKPVIVDGKGFNAVNFMSDLRYVAKNAKWTPSEKNEFFVKIGQAFGIPSDKFTSDSDEELLELIQDGYDEMNKQRPLVEEHKKVNTVLKTDESQDCSIDETSFTKSKIDEKVLNQMFNDIGRGPNRNDSSKLKDYLEANDISTNSGETQKAFAESNPFVQPGYIKKFYSGDVVADSSSTNGSEQSQVYNTDSSSDTTIDEDDSYGDDE